jgi:hypothetical protein
LTFAVFGATVQKVPCFSGIREFRLCRRLKNRVADTDRQFRASLDRSERATSDLSFLVSFPQIGARTVSFFVSFPENALRSPISFFVSIVKGAPVGEGASVFGWPK